MVETPAVEDVKWKDGEPLTIQVRVEIGTDRDGQGLHEQSRGPKARRGGREGARQADRGPARVARAPRGGQGRQGGRERFPRSSTTPPRATASLFPNAKGSSELVDMSAEQSVEGPDGGVAGHEARRVKEHHR